MGVLSPHFCIAGGGLGASKEKGGGGSRTRLTPAFSGAQKWAEVLHNPAFSGVPNKGDKIRIGCLTRAFLGAKRGRKCYITPAFSGVPNKRDKIRIGCLTPAFAGAQKRAEMLRHPYIFRDPQQREQNQNWLPHPCLRGGPKEGGNAT